MLVISISKFSKSSYFPPFLVNFLLFLDFFIIIIMRFDRLILIINTIVSYDQNMLLIFYVKDGSLMSGGDTPTLYSTEPVRCSTKNNQR